MIAPMLLAGVYGVVLLGGIEERLGLCFGSWSSAISWIGATRRITHPFVEPQVQVGCSLRAVRHYLRIGRITRAPSAQDALKSKKRTVVSKLSMVYPMTGPVAAATIYAQKFITPTAVPAR